MAALAMIESPTTTTLLDTDTTSKPPAYTEEPDAPLAKDSVMIDDIPVVLVKSKPITSQATYKFLAHLRSVGGFFARWRGFKQYIVYKVAFNVLAHATGGLIGKLTGQFIGRAIGMTLAVIITCRLHMLWTHAMIGSPTSTPWYKRFIPRKQCKVLLLPSLIYALAQQMVIVVPICVASLLRVTSYANPEQAGSIQHMSNAQLASLFFRILSVPISAFVVAICLVIPAKATLTRIEACLLPEEQETIVSFDKETIMGEIDVTQRGSSKQMFVAAWKSFSRAARWRVFQVYFKAVFYQFYIMFMGFAIAATVVYLSNRTEIKKWFNQQEL